MSELPLWIWIAIIAAGLGVVLAVLVRRSYLRGRLLLGEFEKANRLRLGTSQPPLEESSLPELRSLLPSPAAVYLQWLELRDIRCFESLRIEFVRDGQFQLRTTILGDNALGKSTLLRAIAIALCNESDATALMTAIPGAMIRAGAKEATIRLGLSGDDRSAQEAPLEIVKIISRTTDGSEVLRQITQPAEFPWPMVFVCAYGTQRTVAATASFEAYSSRLAVATLFDAQAPLQNPEVALLRQERGLRTVLQGKLLSVMLLDSGAIEETPGGLRVRGPWGTAAFDVLSDGYRSTSQWLLDLFAWMAHAGRLPASTEPAGILLIDEIEQHLHPRWQRHIVQRLSTQLPRLQIITTTHTPLVASGMADVDAGGLLRLYTDVGGRILSAIIDPRDLRGKRADQILTEFFDLATSRNPGSNDALTRYVELRSKLHSDRGLEPAEQRELTELTAHLAPILSFGETEVEQKVQQAVSTALDAMLREPPTERLTVEAKRQLRDLFGDTGQQT